jgi:rubrerythrin
LTMSYPFGLYVAGVLRRQREERLALGLCPRCGVPIKDPSQRCPGCDRPIPAALAKHA